MALIIKEDNGVVCLQGNVNSTNCKSVKQHLEIAMNNYRDLELDLRKIDSIDFDGITCFKNILTFAAKNFRKIKIVKGLNKVNITTLQLGV